MPLVIVACVVIISVYYYGRFHNNNHLLIGYDENCCRATAVNISTHLLGIKLKIVLTRVKIHKILGEIYNSLPTFYIIIICNYFEVRSGYNIIFTMRNKYNLFLNGELY
jgi:hypothetical protein